MAEFVQTILQAMQKSYECLSDSFSVPVEATLRTGLSRNSETPTVKTYHYYYKYFASHT